jgi:competence protein ComGC
MTTTEIIIVIVVIAILLTVGMLPRMKKHEACLPADNGNVKASPSDIVEEHIHLYVEQYIHGSINRTEMLGMITSEIQANLNFVHGVPDAAWDYISSYDIHATMLEKSPEDEVLAFNEA